MNLKQDLTEIVGAEHVSDDPEVLEKYSKDFSFVQPRRPSIITFPQNAEEIQKIVKYANVNSMAVTPRSSALGFYGAGIPNQGGIIIDCSRMNKILEVDPRNKKVKVEPGVTYAQVQEELAKHGMYVANPLLPHKAKSVLTSTMEREPILITKSEYSEVFLTSEVVLPTGDMYWTGTALGKGMKGQNFPDALIPGTRLWLGAQGTLGIMTWANLKAEHLPTLDKLFFIPINKVEQIADPVYTIQRKMLGNECFVLNAFNLAMIVAEKWPDEFNTLRDSLPPYTIILCLSGLHRLPEEMVGYQEEALMDLAKELRFSVQRTVGGIAGLEATILKILRKPWQKDVYWKHQYKGACHDVFFHTTMDRVHEFTAMMNETAAKHGYPTRDIGVYIQPLERARAAFCQFSFHCDPNNAREAAMVKKLFLEASENAINLGGFFTTPYGPWADMVYSRTAQYTALLKIVKNAYDPNNVMNPGKLCF
ncbi:MAG: FAD-binding oxidoreductase [Chloroflexota bacterium]